MKLYNLQNNRENQPYFTLHIQTDRAIWPGSTLLDIQPVLLNISPKFQPLHDKTNKMVCAPSKDSDQPGHSPSLISLRWALNGYVRTKCFFMRTAKTDQIGRMPSLIWVFAGPKGHFVSFVVRRLFNERVSTLRRWDVRLFRVITVIM